MTGRIVVLGELMLRLSPPAGGRLDEPNPRIDTYFGGSECNTAVACAAMGHVVEVVTSLPPGAVGDAALATLESAGVRTTSVHRGGRRMGIYYAELATDDRPMTVIYDRAGSSFAEMDPHAIDWPMVLDGAGWLHWSGITPALSATTEDTCRRAIGAAHAAGLPVSCDLNYRPQLWDSVARARSVMTPLLEACTVVCGNAVALEAMTGTTADRDTAETALTALTERFPTLETAVITERVERSSRCHEFSATMRHRSSTYRAGVVIDDIVDRVGGGDAFTAGLLHGLLRSPDEPQAMLEFALAACHLKHSVPGDWNAASVEEIDRVRRLI